MKLLSATSLTLLVLMAVCECNSEEVDLRRIAIPHNLFECVPGKARVKVFERLILKSGRANAVVEESLQYPSIGMSSSPITCISIEDLSHKGKGGYPEIDGGGINYNYVSLSFESQVGGDLQFSVVIYTDYTSRPISPYYSAPLLPLAPAEAPAELQNKTS